MKQTIWFIGGVLATWLFVWLLGAFVNWDLFWLDELSTYSHQARGAISIIGTMVSMMGGLLGMVMGDDKS